jgi:hypothetical protein
MDFNIHHLSESLSLKIDTNKLKELLESILRKIESHEDRLFTLESQILSKADIDKVVFIERNLSNLKEHTTTIDKRVKISEKILYDNKLTDFDSLMKTVQGNYTKINTSFSKLDNDFKTMKIELDNYYMLNMNLEGKVNFIQQDLQSADTLHENSITKLTKTVSEIKEKQDRYDENSQLLKDIHENITKTIEDYNNTHIETIEELKRKVEQIENISKGENSQPKVFSFFKFKRSVDHMEEKNVREVEVENKDITVAKESRDSREAKETKDTPEKKEIKDTTENKDQLLAPKPLTDLPSSMKSIDSSHRKSYLEVQIGSLKRRVKLIEDNLIKMNIPTDVNFSHFIKDSYSMKDQFISVLNLSKTFNTQLEKLKKMEIPKNIVTVEQLKELFNKYEEILLTKISELIDEMTRSYADKKLIKRSFRYLENLVSDHNIPIDHADDKAMATKKPLNKISCLSCEATVNNFKATKANHTSWSKMRPERPGRNCRGFSQMLSRVKIEQGSSFISTIMNSPPSVDIIQQPKKIWRPNSSFHA